MAAAIRELTLSLPREKMTPQEENFVKISVRKALKELASGILIAFAPAMICAGETKPNFNGFNMRAGLSIGIRSCLASVSVTLFGYWRFKRSLDSWVDPILAMDGSPMQRNLANIIVNKYNDDHWLRQRLSRHFYVEKVYDDRNSDEPMVWLRYRNCFVDNVAHSEQEKHDNGSLVVSSHDDVDGKNAHIESNKVSLDTDADHVMEDPLDFIFGWSDRPFSSAPTAKEHNQTRRRSHSRRRRMHHELLGMKHT